MDVDHSNRAFRPTLVETVSLLFISLMALIFVNLLPALSAERSTEYTEITSYTKDFIERTVAPVENQQTSNIMVLAFWSAVGVALYVIVWLIATVIHGYKNDLPPSKSFVMPQGMIHQGIWYSAIGRVLVRFLATLGFLYWLYLLLGSIFPFVSSNFLDALTDLPNIWPLVVLSSVILLAISLYVAVILARCIFLRERVFKP